MGMLRVLETELKYKLQSIQYLNQKKLYLIINSQYK